MDLGNIIMAIILLAICTMPFALMLLNKRKIEKKLINNLLEVNEGKEVLWTKYETMVDMIIALDENSNHLYFYKESKREIQKFKIDLDDYSDCKVIKINDNEDNSEIDSTISSIFIHLIAKETKAKDLKLEIYDRNDSFGMSGELIFANEWSTLINEKLKKSN